MVDIIIRPTACPLSPLIPWDPATLRHQQSCDPAPLQPCDPAPFATPDHLGAYKYDPRILIFMSRAFQNYQQKFHVKLGSEDSTEEIIIRLTDCALATLRLCDLAPLQPCTPAPLRPCDPTPLHPCALATLRPCDLAPLCPCALCYS